MKIEKIALQCYSIRDYMQNLEDFKVSMEKVKKIGYQAVQLSGLGPEISMPDAKKACDDSGLTICATHESAASFVDAVDRVIQRLNDLDCKLTAYPNPHLGFETKDKVLELCGYLNAAGEKMQAVGQTLTYHNHNQEFAQFDGECILDIIYNNTDKVFVQGEIDCYWVQAGGGDCVEWIEKLSGRMPMIHLKDYGIDSPCEVKIKEIGQGNLNWDRIIAAAEKTPIEWYIIEQDNNWIDNDPFKSVAVSFQYVSERYAS